MYWKRGIFSFHSKITELIILPLAEVFKVWSYRIYTISILQFFISEILFFSINFYICLINSRLAYLILGFPMLISGRKTVLHHDSKRRRKEFCFVYLGKPTYL